MYEFLEWEKSSSKFQQMRKDDYMVEVEDQILNLLSDGIYIKKDDIIVFSNTMASKILSGDEGSSIIGLEFNKLIQPIGEYKKKYIMVLDKEKKEDRISSTFFKVVRLMDNKELDVEFSERVILYKGEKAFLGVIRDISSNIVTDIFKREYEKSSKLLQQTIEHDRMKTEFYENLTHELRTPLNVILGVSQLQDVMLKNKDFIQETKKLEKYNKILKQNCYRLMKLVNNLLDITKMESGYLELNLKNDNIVAVVEDITLSVVEYARSRDLELVFDTEVEEKIMAFDADHVERIVMNLLSNAIKFTPPGGSIYVIIRDLDKEVKISVIDEGEGIPLEKQEKLFKRFSQVDKNYSRKNRGTGIGLSLVKSLVELHQGEIDLKSDQGKGCEFSVILPAKVIEKLGVAAEDNCIRQSRVERVSIEFSDIYNVDVITK